MPVMYAQAVWESQPVLGLITPPSHCSGVEVPTHLRGNTTHPIYTYSPVDFTVEWVYLSHGNGM